MTVVRRPITRFFLQLEFRRFPAVYFTPSCAGLLRGFDEEESFVSFCFSSFAFPVLTTARVRARVCVWVVVRCRRFTASGAREIEAHRAWKC